MMHNNWRKCLALGGLLCLWMLPAGAAFDNPGCDDDHSKLLATLDGEEEGVGEDDGGEDDGEHGELFACRDVNARLACSLDDDDGGGGDPTDPADPGDPADGDDGEDDGHHGELLAAAAVHGAAPVIAVLR